jgi:hypothetical protein
MDNKPEDLKKTEPHVTILGGEVSGPKKADDALSEEKREAKRAPNRERGPEGDGGWIVGIVLVLAGAVLVLNNYGVVSWEIWSALAVFWPIALIIVGVKMVLGRSAVSRALSALIALALILFVLFVALAGTDPALYASLDLPPWLANVINRFK